MPEPGSLILASASPRRRELLEQIGVAHEIRVADLDECALPREVPAEYVLRLALAKARAVAARLTADDIRPVLGADTAVVIDRQILGKPGGRDEALRQLQLLSGREHEVLTGVALAARKRITTRLSVSHVRFRHLEETEITAYWDSGEPEDKAGSYAIQGHAAVFIEEIRGSYSGIMGLPLFETAELLRAAGHPLRFPRVAG
jgi:septum formation protein